VLMRRCTVRNALAATGSTQREKGVIMRFGPVVVCLPLIRIHAEARRFSMSNELPIRPTCPSCGSTRVGTLAKQITADTAWRCADCGETFKAKPVSGK
jgi:transposase-like protein